MKPTNLMVVAHPFCELIWGWNLLLDKSGGTWGLICCDAGLRPANPTRSKLGLAILRND